MPWWLVSILAAIAATLAAIALLLLPGLAWKCVFALAVLVFLFVLMRNPKHRYIRLSEFVIVSWIAARLIPSIFIGLKLDEKIGIFSSDSQMPVGFDISCAVLAAVLAILHFLTNYQNGQLKIGGGTKQFLDGSGTQINVGDVHEKANVNIVVNQPPPISDIGNGDFMSPREPATDTVISRVDDVHSDVNKVLAKLNQIKLPDVAEHYDDRLDQIKSKLEDHDYESAKILCEQIEGNEFEKLTPSQKRIVATYYGQAFFATGDYQSAANKFVNAEAFERTEQSQTNKAFGLELLGKRNEAIATAKQLVDENPNNTKCIALLIRVDHFSREEVESFANKHDDAEILVAASFKMTANRELGKSISFLEKAVANSPSWAMAWLLLGQERMKQCMSQGFKTIGSGLVLTDSEPNDVFQPIEKAIEICTDDGDNITKVQALVARGQAKKIFNDKVGAEEDFKSAYNLDKNHCQAISRYGQYLFESSQREKAELLLRSAVDGGCTGDTSYYLAALLSSKGEGNEIREEIIEQLSNVASDLKANHFTDAVDWLVNLYIESGDIENATSLLDILPSRSVLFRKSLESRIEYFQENFERSIELNKEVLAALDEQFNCEAASALLVTLQQQNCWNEAMQLAYQLVKVSHSIVDAYHLSDISKRLEKYGLFLEVAELFRSHSAFDLELLNRELDVLERFAPKKALAVGRQIQNCPIQSKLMTLRLSCLGIRHRDDTIVAKDQNALPSIEEITPHNAQFVVMVLIFNELFDEAAQFAYGAYKKHAQDPRTNTLLVSLVFGQAFPKGYFDAGEEVTPDSAVYYEDAANATKKIVVESENGYVTQDDEIHQSSDFARKLLGKQVGAEIELSQTGSGRKIQIKEIVHKIVYRARKIADEWAPRFFGKPGPEMFHMDFSDETNGIPDLTPIIERTHGQKKYIEQTLETYLHNPVPINGLANATGRHIIDVVEFLAYNEKMPIRCAFANRNEFQEKSSIFADATIVLDITAIATLIVLESVDVIESLPFSLTASTDTERELRHFVELRKAESENGKSIVPSDVGLGIQFVERNPAFLKAEYEKLDACVRVIEQSVEFIDCVQLADMPKVRREDMVGLFGIATVENILLSQADNHYLWADDFTIALAAKELGVERTIWTQCLLNFALTNELLSQDKMDECSAKMIGFGYFPTYHQESTLMKGIELSNWKPAESPLKQMLDNIQHTEHFVVNTAILTRLIALVMRKPIRVPDHGIVIRAFLDRVMNSPSGAARIGAIESALPLIFGVEASLAVETSQLIGEWKRSRGI